MFEDDLGSFLKYIAAFLLSLVAGINRLLILQLNYWVIRTEFPSGLHNCMNMLERHLFLWISTKPGSLSSSQSAPLKPIVHPEHKILTE